MPYLPTLAAISHIATAVGFLIAPLAAASAAGLGKLSVHSTLGQPLNAEVDIVSLGPGEAESVVARIAPEEVYRQSQLTPIPPPQSVRAAVEQTVRGEYVVRLRTARPIEQPLVNLLVELSWRNGSALRQYSFLLDSINSVPSGRALLPAPRDAVDSPTTSASDPAPQSSGRDRGPGTKTTARNVHTVQPGETLFGIAQVRQHKGTTIPQMMVAIHRSNKDAFAGGEIDRLLAGNMLTIPSRDAVLAINAAEARQITERYFPAAKRNRSANAVRAPATTDTASADRALVESRDRIDALEQRVAGLRQLIQEKDREIMEFRQQQRTTNARPQPADQ